VAAEPRGGIDDGAFARALEPRAFRFPADHGSHPEFKTEWWYVTGSLEGEKGAIYGFQATWFRVAVAASPTPRASDLAARDLFFFHGAITDVDRRKFAFGQKACRGVSDWAGSAVGDLDVFLLTHFLRREEDGAWHLRFKVEDREADLRLVPEREPLLHGETPGLSLKGPQPGEASYYYSQTRLRVEGSLRLAPRGERVRVGGRAWFDHEFGSHQLADDQVGWDWFSVALDDGTDLMLYLLRRNDGTVEATSAGTLRFADGRRVPLGAQDFRVEVLGRWKSDRSGGDYPCRWRIEVPEHGLDLEVYPLLPDQELRTRGTAGVNYFEGLSRFRGVRGGTKVEGLGYVELVGYAGDFLAGL